MGERILNNLAPNSPLANTAERLVDRIFEQLLASCPSIQYWTAEQVKTAKQQWVLGFAENGITTIEQVKRGMQALRRKDDDFVPSVGKFIRWCEPDYSIFGLPAESDVMPRYRRFLSVAGYDEHEFKYHSPAEYWLLRTLWIRGNSAQESDMPKIVKQVLAEAMDKVRSGFQFPPIPKKLTVKRPPFNAELGKRNLALMREMMRETPNH